MEPSDFRVRLLPTLFLLISAILLLPLTVWQFDRFVEQAEIEDLRDSRIGQEPRAIRSAEELDRDDVLFRRVVAHGELSQNAAFVLDPSQGGRCQVVSPLLFADGTVALVNRGYVPAERRMRCKRDELELVTADEWHALVATPEGNIPDQITRAAADDRDWATLDVEGLLESWDLQSDAPVVLLLDPRHEGDPLPRPSWDRVTSPYLTAVTHLSYSATWLMVFLVCVGFWVVTCMGAFDRRRDD